MIKKVSLALILLGLILILIIHGMLTGCASCQPMMTPGKIQPLPSILLESEIKVKCAWRY